MTEITLIRHGETVAPGRLIGRTDVALSEAGLTRTLAALATRRWAVLIASPLARARAPASRHGELTGRAVAIDARFGEMDFGAWDGLDLATLRTTVQREVDAFYRDPVAHPPPAGETWGTFSGRVGDGLDALIASEPQGPVAVVTHGGVMRAVVALACGIAVDRLWALRIGYGARLVMDVGRGPDGALWGEIVELVQG